MMAISNFITLNSNRDTSLQPQSSLDTFDFDASAFIAYRNKWKGVITSRLVEIATASDAEFLDCVNYLIENEGKYIRPLLTMMACEITGGKAVDALDYACAIELIHLSSLILDDLPCMDDSDTRRGRAALHVKFGEARALLTTILLICTSFRLVAEGGPNASKAVSILARSLTDSGMILGQMKDLQGYGKDNSVIHMKTGSLIEAAALLGVLAGSDNQYAAQQLSSLSCDIAYIFQVRDDVLDGDMGQKAQESAKKRAYRLATITLNTFGCSPASQALASLAVFAAIRKQ
ncbi:polyprenyl synthetase family protein [Zooshikella sp. RANM57]|uniref:polyprenyl synthetase family protein n=1 Tax=Zooshikella sp. RANM57 TaxID=3425863 RepID=UPI003D6F77A4